LEIDIVALEAQLIPMPDNFINIPFTTENLDRYYIRASILDSLTRSLNHFKGNVLDIGCGKKPYKDFILKNSTVEKYIGLDIENALEYDAEVKPDYTWDGISMPFQKEQFETAFCTEVLEHCPKPDLVLNEVYRVLKSEGVFFFTVPFIWPLHEVPHDEFRYTPFSLKRLLEEAGFVNIEIKATGGWHASLAQMLGLWVRRAPLSPKKRNLLSNILKPVIKYLIKKDKKLPEGFHESQMISGLSGIAFKK
jgi:ubiquinone/menaquinone biosynthesis C-methylase UbiE